MYKRLLTHDKIFGAGAEDKSLPVLAAVISSPYDFAKTGVTLISRSFASEKEANEWLDRVPPPDDRWDIKDEHLVLALVERDGVVDVQRLNDIFRAFYLHRDEKVIQETGWRLNGNVVSRVHWCTRRMGQVVADYAL